MLEDLLSGKEKSKWVLIEDRLETPGRALLKCFATDCLKRNASVYAVCLESQPSEFVRGIDTQLLDRLISLDGCKDPLGWEETSKADRTIYGYDLSTVFQDVSPSNITTVLIDSLSPCLLHKSVTETCRALHHITYDMIDTTSQLIALVHSDAHEERTLETLEYQATTIIKLGNVSDGGHLSCSVLHKRAGGHVIRVIEEYGISDKYELVKAPKARPLESPTDNAGPDPTANLTFNLGLTEEERHTKEKLQLPYTRNIGHSVAGGGAIIYQPDEADDFDEEDPDDDLDM